MDDGNWPRKIWLGKQDRKHELQIISRQMEQMRLGHNQRLEEITVNADISECLAVRKPLPHGAVARRTGNKKRSDNS